MSLTKAIGDPAALASVIEQILDSNGFPGHVHCVGLCDHQMAQSESVQLVATQDSDVHHLFLKYSVGNRIASGQPLWKRLHALRSRWNEIQFYEHVAPLLRDCGLEFPEVLATEVNFDARQLDLDDDGVDQCHAAILMCRVDPEWYHQVSPVSVPQACAALRFLARFHAAAMGNKVVMEAAHRWLHPRGGTWTLDKRGRGPVATLPAVWRSFVERFSPLDHILFARPAIHQLGDRLAHAVDWVDSQLWGSSVALPHSTAIRPLDTLVHGDFKAMNAFLPRGEWPEGQVLPIDFEWTGAGYGLVDVAYHLVHSFSVHRVEADEVGFVARAVGLGATSMPADEVLVLYYRQELVANLISQGKHDLAAQHTPAHCTRLYKLAFLDYGRMVLSEFYRDASPEGFAARQHHPNVSLVNRSVHDAFTFIERLDSFLTDFDAELTNWCPKHSS
eukprot:EG_transcript_12071